MLLPRELNEILGRELGRARSIASLGLVAVGSRRRGGGGFGVVVDSQGPFESFEFGFGGFGGGLLVGGFEFEEFGHSEGEGGGGRRERMVSFGFHEECKGICVMYGMI